MPCGVDAHPKLTSRGCGYFQDRGNLLGLLDLFNRTKKDESVMSDSLKSLEINTKVVGLIEAKFSEMSVIEWPDLFCEA
jgi:hypothetical protein